MKYVDPVLLDGATKTFEDLTLKFVEPVNRSTDHLAWSSEIWSTIAADGWTSIALPEEMDGAGCDWPTIIAIMKLAGFYRLPIPFAEHVLATRFLANARETPPEGPLSLFFNSNGAALTLSNNKNMPVLNGEINNIPWGRFSGAIISIIETEEAAKLIAFETASLKSRPCKNIADEPRDGYQLENCNLLHDPIDVSGSDHFYSCYAIARSALIAGATQKVLELAVNYANERKQFGRPIGKFQAVQNHLAIMAEQVSATSVAVDSAAAAIETDMEFAMAASAKVISGRAASEVSKRAHAVFAAIGFTQEFELNFLTRRLWAWRDDGGSEHDWSRRLGRIVTAKGGDQLWPWLTGSET